MISIDSDTINFISKTEKIRPEKLERLIKNYNAVIVGREEQKLIAIGKSLQTKVNVNLGTSPAICDGDKEIEKAKIAQRYGADTISDCSVTNNNDKLRKSLISSVDIPLMTVPIYQAVVDAKSFDDVSDEVILKTIEKHVADGVASIVIHSGFSRDSLEFLKKNRRIMGIVSKGGSMCAAISLSQNRENPFVTLFEDIIEIIKGTNVVLNLGNAMRSGSVHDFKDSVQYQEIVNNTKLAKIANKNGVQVIIEGLGGHVNAHNLGEWVSEHNKITGDRPLFVAGPLPTEIGVGYDHISAAIGGAIAAGYGADYLCAITPAEHLSLPNKEHIREGVISAKIAAHVGDSIKYGISDYFEGDRLLSEYRAKKDWTREFDFALDEDKAKSIHPPNQKECSMCGKYCAIATMEKYLFSK